MLKNQNKSEFKINLKEDENINKNQEPLSLSKIMENKYLNEIISKDEEPILLNFMKKKYLEEKEKNITKSKNKNETKYNPPIKRIKGKISNYNKAFEINNLKTIGNLSDKSIKRFTDSYSYSYSNSNRSSINQKQDILEINQNKNLEKILKLDISIIKNNEYELNILSYKDALKEDKRSYIQYYFSLLKIKHLFIFSFFPINDYNSRIIKIDLFFFYFTISYTVNGFFFDDVTMHQIYQDGGKFNFVYQIPLILYSLLITSILNTIIKGLSLSENSILEIKHENINFLDKKGIEIINCLFYKYIIFFIISFPLLFFCFYYIGCFCAVFRNTQIHLIKDSLLSLALHLLYPIFLYLLPGIFRIPALRSKKKNKEILYKLSKFIQYL